MKAEVCETHSQHSFSTFPFVKNITKIINLMCVSKLIDLDDCQGDSSGTLLDNIQYSMSQ